MTGSSSTVNSSSMISAGDITGEFGRMVRRALQATSAPFKPLPQTPPQPVLNQTFNIGNRDWTRYKELAELAAKRGNYSQAEAMWLAALIEAKDFDQQDERVAITLDNLASLYYTLGRYDQAESFCRRALDVTILALGGLHRRVAECLNSLAGIYYNQKRYAAAEPLCVRALAIYERVFGPDHGDVGMAANNLAMLYHAQGKYSDAERYYQQAIRIRTKVLGTDHPCVITLLENYANLLKAMDRLHEADALKTWSRASHQGMNALSAAG